MSTPITVAASGGFDPIHVGHLRYLQAARGLGDKLVVILNTDDFLERKKGYAFMPGEERKEILLGLACVDEVVFCIDDDQTVCKTLEMLKPTIFAKGGDRTADNIPEYAVCEANDIQMVFGVGGSDKPQSSSWLVDKAKKGRDEVTHRDRSTNKGEEYVRMYSANQKWINQCGSCQARGLKPQTPGYEKPGPGATTKELGTWNRFRHLHDYFKVLELDGNGLCNFCRE